MKLFSFYGNYKKYNTHSFVLLIFFDDVEHKRILISKLSQQIQVISGTFDFFCHDIGFDTRSDRCYKACLKYNRTQPTHFITFFLRILKIKSPDNLASF